jgi:hypothetical protein
MSDPDPLLGRFAAFRDASIAATTRPGVDAVRRRVSRRDATRTLAAALLVVLVAAALLWFSRPLPSAPPVTPPRASAGPVSAAPSPSASAPVPSASASASTRPTAGSATVPDGTAAFCARRDLALMTNSDPMIPVYSDYFTHCPSVRLRAYAVTYEWDLQRQQYTVAHINNAYLTAAQPSTPRPQPELDPISGACGYLTAVIQADVDPPAALPVAATDAFDVTYWHQFKNLQVLAETWTFSKAADLAKRPLCQPQPGGGSPT